MAAHHNRKPVYYRDNSPNDVNVNDIKDHIYQWYETGNRPTEVENGLAWMPPMENNGDTLVWSDSNTLGYNFIPNAPMFWSDGGVGGEKILQMINHCSNRKSDIQFNDLESGISWILNQSDIYTNLSVSTPANPATGQVTISLYNWNDYANAPSLLGFVVNGDGYGTARNGFSLGPNVPWLPVAAGSSSVAGNFNITPMGSVEVLMYMDYFLGNPYVGNHHIYVNNVKWGSVTVTANSGLGAVVRGHVIQGTGQTANLADGDDIKIVTKTATNGQMPEIFPGSVSTYNLAQGGATQHTVTFTNNTNEVIGRLELDNQEFHGSGYEIAPGYGNEASWLPLAPGESVELTGVNSFYGNGGSGTGTTLQIGLGIHFTTSATRTGYVSVNGAAGNPYNFNANGTTNYFNAARSGYTSLQNGDTIVVNFTN